MCFLQQLCDHRFLLLPRVLPFCALQIRPHITYQNPTVLVESTNSALTQEPQSISPTDPNKGLFSRSCLSLPWPPHVTQKACRVPLPGYVSTLDFSFSISVSFVVCCWSAAHHGALCVPLNKHQFDKFITEVKGKRLHKWDEISNSIFLWWIRVSLMFLIMAEYIF